MFFEKRGHRALLLSAVATTVLISVPALAEPIPAATATVTPPGGVDDTVSDSGGGTAAASRSFTSGNNSGNVNVFADAGGNTRAGADLGGSGAANGTAHLTENILNNSTSIVDYYFSFKIYGGYLSLFDDSLSVDAGDSALAAMSSMIHVNSEQIWSLDAELQLAGGVYSVTDDNSLSDDSDVLSNFSSGSDANGASANWSASYFRVYIGTLVPTQQMTMEYFLSASVFANYGGECSEDDGYGDGYGYGVASLSIASTTTGCYETLAVVSDPGGIDPEPAFGLIAEPRAASVPEPATLALMGVGLAGMGLARRRRFKKG